MWKVGRPLGPIELRVGRVPLSDVLAMLNSDKSQVRAVTH